MKRINLTFTEEELKLLASLASDQLFRRQFIDPKMPGYRGSAKDIELGKELVGRLRSMADINARADGNARNAAPVAARAAVSKREEIL
jgi:hypothetical protein